MDGIKVPMTMEFLKGEFESLVKTSEQVQAQVKDCMEIMRRQNQMIDIAVGLFASLADDNEISVAVKRRIVFALQQMKGLANLS